MRPCLFLRISGGLVTPSAPFLLTLSHSPAVERTQPQVSLEQGLNAGPFLCLRRPSGKDRSHVEGKGSKRSVRGVAQP